MSITWPFIWLITAILFENGSVPTFPEGIFTAKEKKKIEKNADDLEERLEAYRDASIRINEVLRKAVSKRDYEKVPDLLEKWMALLSGSMKDIESNLDPEKKRPRDLIKYEIQIRKSINDIRDYKVRAPGDQQDIFNSCIDRAEIVRIRMVEILFNPEQQE